MMAQAMFKGQGWRQSSQRTSPDTTNLLSHFMWVVAGRIGSIEGVNKLGPAELGDITRRTPVEPRMLQQ